MRNGDIVLNLSTNSFDAYKYSELSSGYTMHRVGEDLLYSGQFINVSGKFYNSELWRIVENNNLPKGLVISNQYNSSYVYDGISSFVSSEENDRASICPFNKGDIWTIDQII